VLEVNAILQQKKYEAAYFEDEAEENALEQM